MAKSHIEKASLKWFYIFFKHVLLDWLMTFGYLLWMDLNKKWK